MTLDRSTRFLFATFTFALLLNGLNPWLIPPEAGAREDAAAAVNVKPTDCSLARENSSKSLDGVNSVKRMLGSIESSVNDIKLTLAGVDRKVNKIPHGR